MLNPPYEKHILTKIIVMLVKMATAKRKVFAVLVPVKPDESWYQLCVEMSYPILKFSQRLAFQRGVELAYKHCAPFDSCWILIGVETKHQFINIDSDILGFPHNWDFTDTFLKAHDFSS